MQMARRENPQTLAKALGWFSVALGLAEVTAPRTVARLIGLNGGSPSDIPLLRGFGLRELAAGVGILSRPQQSLWLWSRVAGDALDLAYLGNAYKRRGVQRDRLTSAVAAVAAVTALDILAGSRKHAETNGATEREPAQVERQAVVTVNRPPADVYRFWRRLENLPLFMSHLQSVEERDDRRSHWVVSTLGTTVEWDAEITEDAVDERIAWRAVENADVPNEGTVTFRPAPGGRGTEIRVETRFEPPAGKIAEVFAKLLGADPARTMEQDLRRLKQVLEAGEIATTVGQPSGTRSLVGSGLRRLEERAQS